MKTYTKYLALAIFAVAASLNTGCSNEKNEKSANDSLVKDSLKTDTTAAPVVLKDSIAQSFYNDYIHLKDALVRSNAGAAQQAAATLTAKLGKDRSAVAAKEIAGAAELPAQRKAFTSLSNDLIAYFKANKPASGKIYVQHCPMANNGDGGDWLSSEKVIRNPYYGDEMLECGAVLEEIK